MNTGDNVVILTKGWSIKDLIQSSSTDWVKFGVVQREYQLDEDYSHHGSAWYPIVVEVVDEDGKLYNDFFQGCNFYKKSTLTNILLNEIDRLKTQVNNANLFMANMDAKI